MTFPLLFVILTAFAQQKGNYKSIFIENQPWPEARMLLRDTTIVVLPLGAESKEHGPHLQLKNDWLIAEYLKERVAKEAEIQRLTKTQEDLTNSLKAEIERVPNPGVERIRSASGP